MTKIYSLFLYFATNKPGTPDGGPPPKPNPGDGDDKGQGGTGGPFIPGLDESYLHRNKLEECTESEKQTKHCVNGGTCYKKKDGENKDDTDKDLICICLCTFTGDTCQSMYHKLIISRKGFLVGWQATQKCSLNTS